MKVLRTCPRCRFRGYHMNVRRTGEDGDRPLLSCGHCKHEWFVTLRRSEKEATDA